MIRTACTRILYRGFSTSANRSKAANMPLKFAANISMMFQEIPTLAERYQAAKNAGFQFVECTFPYQEKAEDLSKARIAAGLDHVLINGYPGDLSSGDLGIAALPDRVKEFREKLEISIKYATALNCKSPGKARIHIMAGKKPHNADAATLKKMEETFIENLKYAADALKRDFYHCQIMDGNLTQNLKEQLPYIGHIQISQVPDRGEPDASGEICFPYVFSLLEKAGYDGYIGLEYKPRGSTLEGLQWMKQYGY
ncbi:hypothetical protein BaRGS_00007534 [Batillaria attramentaria]|uniref:Putative hydroxypyruvate isomerase n=1 Tax=Batillaria attramentaria TaxID=370345 RepID=A0ABD0LN49_9CAEN